MTRFKLYSLPLLLPVMCGRGGGWLLLLCLGFSCLERAFAPRFVCPVVVVECSCLCVLVRPPPPLSSPRPPPPSPRVLPCAFPCARQARAVRQGHAEMGGPVLGARGCSSPSRLHRPLHPHHHPRLQHLRRHGGTREAPVQPQVYVQPADLRSTQPQGRPCTWSPPVQGDVCSVEAGKGLGWTISVRTHPPLSRAHFLGP